MFDVNAMKTIQKDKPHCGNCFWFTGDDDDELFRFCDEKEEDVPSFGTCQKWRNK